MNENDWDDDFTPGDLPRGTRTAQRIAEANAALEVSHDKLQYHALLARVELLEAGLAAVKVALRRFIASQLNR